MPYKDKNARRTYQRRWMAQRRSDYLTNHPCLECGATKNLIIISKGKFRDYKTTAHTIWSYTAREREKRLKGTIVLCRRHWHLQGKYLASLYKG